MITVIRTTTTTTHLGVTELRINLVPDADKKIYFSLELIGPKTYDTLKKGETREMQVVSIEAYSTNVALVARLLELTGPGPIKLAM